MTTSSAGGAQAAEGPRGSSGAPTEHLVYGHTDDPTLIDSARQLVARRYLAEGYIDASDITPKGVMDRRVDPYHETSAYFVAVDAKGAVVATIRQVAHNEDLGVLSFPFCAHLELYQETWTLLESTPRERWVELSGLAKEPWIETVAANRLYREMWARSFAQGHEHWLIATHPRFARWLKGIFMSSMIEAGKPMEYLGSQTQPLVMHVVAGLDGVCDRYFSSSSPRVRERCKATVEYFLDGIDAAYFSTEQVRRFTEMGVEFTLDLRDGSLVSSDT